LCIGPSAVCFYEPARQGNAHPISIYASKKAFGMQRARTLKWVLAIGLHVLLIALLLYKSLGNQDEKTTPVSIEISLLAEPPGKQPVTPAAAMPQSYLPKIKPPAHVEPSRQPAAVIETPQPKQPMPSPQPLPPQTSPATSTAAPALASSSALAAPPKTESSSAGQAMPSGSNVPASGAYCPYQPSQITPDTAGVYPEKGDVQLSISITAKGTIESVDIRKSSGFSQLDDAVRTTVLQQWRCVPAHRDGKDVASRVGVVVHFILK
jgi:protein TonB